MAEHKAGNTVVLTGTIVEIQDGIAMVKADRFPPGCTIAVPLAWLPDDASASDEDRIRGAMAEAQDHPGRTVTR